MKNPRTLVNIWWALRSLPLKTGMFYPSVMLVIVLTSNVIHADSVNLASTGQVTSYAAGDDGGFQAGEPWPSPRFIDNGDGTVTDQLTGLMWLQNANIFGPGGGMEW